MLTDDVIKAVAKREGIKPGALEATIQKLVGQGRGTLMHKNDTLMLLHPMGPTTAYVHFLSIDGMPALVHAIGDYLSVIRRHGIKRLYTNVQNPQIIEALKQNKAPVMPSDSKRYHLMIKV